MLHYLVALPFEAFRPSIMSAGIEAWSWVISEKPDYEIALLSKITSFWIETLKLEKGLFSKTHKYVNSSCHASKPREINVILSYSDPFYHPVEYSPSEREAVERAQKSVQPNQATRVRHTDQKVRSEKP